MEDRAGSIHRIRRRAESDAEREAGLLARLGRLEKRLERPVLGLRRRAGRIRGLHIDAGMLFHQVDARARPLDLAADRGRHRDPTALGLAEIFDRGIDRAILLDQRLHDVVYGFQVQRLVLWPPGRHGENVVAGFCLRFGGNSQQVLESLRRDVVDLHLDLLLGRPLLNERFGGLVGAGHPVVPEADRELAGGVRGAHERRRDRRCGRRGRSGHESASGKFMLGHSSSSNVRRDTKPRGDS